MSMKLAGLSVDSADRELTLKFKFSSSILAVVAMVLLHRFVTSDEKDEDDE
jgi:hypothetical protein